MGRRLDLLEIGSPAALFGDAHDQRARDFFASTRRHAAGSQGRLARLGHAHVVVRAHIGPRTVINGLADERRQPNPRGA